MSGTIAAAAKARLVGEGSVLSGLAGLAGVVIAYSPPNPIPREYVLGGKVSGSVELMAFRGTNGRLRRAEELNLELQIRVLQMGQRTAEQADARACEIALPICEYIAANPTLGDLPTLKKATVDAVELDGYTEDEAAISVVALTIGLMSFLT